MAAPMHAAAAPRALLNRLVRPSKPLEFAGLTGARTWTQRSPAYTAPSERAVRGNSFATQRCLYRRQPRTKSTFSISSVHRLPARSRSFSATAVQQKDHHFDTLKFVQRLKDEGFTEEQAVAMMRVLSDVIEERFVRHGGELGSC